MPDAVANIGGDASGALAAVAAAQGAIDGMHGRTLNVDINVRQTGGGLAAVAGDMGRVGGAAERVGRSARGMGDSFDRAGRSARTAGDQAARVGDHVGRAADQAERFATHMDAVGNIMRGGAAGAVQHAQGMRSLANEAQSAARAVGSIGVGAQQVQRAIGAGDNGGFRTMGANAHGVSVEVMGIYRNTRQAITAAGEAGSAFSTASGHTSQMGSDLARTGARAGEAGKELARLGESGKELERVGNASRNLGGSGNGLSGMDLAAKGLRDSLGSLTSGFGDVGSTLGGVAGVAGSAARPLMMVGLAAGVGAIGMGALGAAVAGVGLAGVAEDFAHNSQLMNKGQDAVRGFNKEFSKMRSETTASGMPAMDGLATSMKGVGHELAQIGAQNMAPTLNMASQLAGSLTQTMKQLAPAIGPAEKALTALGGAALGAFGNSAPEIARFANIVTQNAGGLQSATESIIRGGSALGGGLVQAVSAAAPFLHGAANAAAWGTDVVSGAAGIPSNFSSTPGPDGSLPGSIDTGIPDGLGGTVHKPGSSTLAKIGSGAFKGGVIGAGVGALFGPEGIPIGGAIGAVAGGIGGAMDVSGLTPGTSPLGDWSGGDKMSLGPVQSQKSMGLSFRPGRFGNFGPGSGGPMVPPGASGADIYGQQYQQSTGVQPGQPMYSGLGPRGGGQSVGPMPVSAAAGLGGGALAPLNDMMSAANRQVAGGGAATGGAITQHIQKAVQTAAPAATAGGASIGGAINAGTAAGSTSTQNVVDTVIIKHSKHIIDLATAALGIHSPSTEFDYLGRMTSLGYAQGIVRESHRAGTAATGLFGQAKSGYDYQDGGPPSISFNPRNPAMAQPGKDDDPAQVAADWRKAQGTQQGQFQPGSNAWWAAHDNRAAELAAGRANRRQIAKANIGAVDPSTGQRVLDPRRVAAGANINPFQGGPASMDPVRREAFSRLNPLSQLSAMFHKAGEGSALGLSQGMTAHVSKVQAAGGALAGAGHGGYRKKDKQASPSAEWAAMAGNSVAGAVGGMAAGIPALAAAGAGAAGAMQAAAVGPMSDSGLQIGNTWSKSVLSGAQTSLKTANFQGGTPDVDNEQIRTVLAGTGSLGGYGGASVYKSPSVSFDGGGAVAALTAAIQQVTSQPTHIHLDLDGQPFRDLVVDGGNQLLEVLLNALGGANG